MRRVVLLALLTSCASQPSHPVSRPAPAPAPEPAPAHLATAIPAEAPASKPDTKPTFEDWLKARLPRGGSLEGGQVVHTAAAGDTSLSIAKAYLELTDVYLADDLAKEIKTPRPGAKIAIPHVVKEPWSTERLGWPEDKSLRAIFLVGDMGGGKNWLPTLDRVNAKGLNAVVLDAKAYEGDITYPTKVKVAVETKAAARAPIKDLARTIRFAHARGVRVIMRISCFHDPFMAEHAQNLSLKGKWGGAYPIGWLDPQNPDVHQYVIDLANESMDAGADEIQLDYVRFPVQKGLGNAVLPPADGSREKVIHDFVAKVHAVTKPRGVPLSVDVFGVTATGTIVDEHNLGQNIAILGTEVEAISPMVYPAHYDKGYMGWDQPGNHPEIIGIGSKAAVEKLAKANVTGVVVRPWLQAFGWRCPDYGPNYLRQETVEAAKGGAIGWLMWNPGCDYSEAWKQQQKFF